MSQWYLWVGISLGVSLEWFHCYTLATQPITILVVTSKFSDKVSLYNQDCKFPHTITFVECSNSCKINNTCI